MSWSAIRALILLFAGILISRLCHLRVVWVEEAYPAAAALQILNGKALYRDIWFDKPPLSATTYLLWGAQAGLPLRLAGTIFIFLCCLAVFLFAREAWTEREGMTAAALLAFFLTFGVPSAVMPLAPDILMVLPHTLAVFFAWRGRALLSGLLAGIALLVNGKALFVLAACLLWAGPVVLAGFAIPAVASLLWFGRPYYEQVWQWGALYSAHGFAWQTGFVRTLNWAGFQAALLLGAAVFFLRRHLAPNVSEGKQRLSPHSRSGLDLEKNWRWAGWVLLSFMAVAAGWRFFPRYYFQLLPPLVLLSARGYTLLNSKRWMVLALLLIPLVRFGPRYIQLAFHPEAPWSDRELEQDSRAAASLMKPAGTLLVWGYRPDIFVFSRLPAGTPFLDSQPLTGVLADRHLTNSDSVAPELAKRNRQRLIETAPMWIADGLEPLNPSLAITQYPDLHAWLQNYEVAGHTRETVVYRRKVDQRR